QDYSGGLGVNGRLTSSHCTDRTFEIKALNVLDYEAPRTRLDTLRDQILIGKGRENNDRCLWIALCDGAADFNSAHPRQAYVEQDHIRTQPFDQFKCLFRIRGITYNRKVRLRYQHRLEPFA